MLIIRLTTQQSKISSHKYLERSWTWYRRVHPIKSNTLLTFCRSSNIKREGGEEKKRRGGRIGSCQVQQRSSVNATLVGSDPLIPLPSTATSVNWCSNTTLTMKGVGEDLLPFFFIPFPLLQLVMVAPRGPRRTRAVPGAVLRPHRHE